MSIASACMHVWPKNLKHKAIANSTIVFIANYVHHHMQSLMFIAVYVPSVTMHGKPNSIVKPQVPA